MTTKPQRGWNRLTDARVEAGITAVLDAYHARFVRPVYYAVALLAGLVVALAILAFAWR